MVAADCSLVKLVVNAANFWVISRLKDIVYLPRKSQEKHVLVHVHIRGGAWDHSHFSMSSSLLPSSVRSYHKQNIWGKRFLIPKIHLSRLWQVGRVCTHETLFWTLLSKSGLPRIVKILLKVSIRMAKTSTAEPTTRTVARPARSCTVLTAALTLGKTIGLQLF